MGSTFPLISIIIAAENTATTIAATVGGACNQDYPNLEILLVDDASADGTREAVAPYLADSRFRYLPSTAKLGVAANHNRGIAQAHGEYISCIGGADMLMPGAISHLHAYFTAHPHTDLVYGDAATMQPAETQAGQTAEKGRLRVAYGGGRNEFAHLLAQGAYVEFATILARRSIYEHYGLFDERPAAIHHEMTIRWAAHQARFAYIPECLLTRSAPSTHPLADSRAGVCGDRLRDLVLLHESYVTPRYIDHLRGYEQSIAQNLNQTILEAQNAGYVVDQDLTVRIATCFNHLQRAYDINCRQIGAPTLCFAVLSNGDATTLRTTLESLYRLPEFPFEVVVFEQPGASCITAIRDAGIAASARFYRTAVPHANTEAFQTCAVLSRADIFVWLQSGQTLAATFPAECRAAFADAARSSAIFAATNAPTAALFACTRNSLDAYGYRPEAITHLIQTAGPR